MRLTVRLCAAVAAVVSVVVAVEHVAQREVHNNRWGTASPLIPEESLIYVRNRRLSSETQGQQWARPNIYSRHYTQEEPDTYATYWANQHLRGRYHSPGGQAGSRNLHTEDMSAARHESRAPQPMRTTTDTVNDPSFVSRTRITEDERFSSRVHQTNLQTSTNDRRRLPHSWGSHETRVPPISRDRLSDDEAWAAYTPSASRRDHEVYSGSLFASSRPIERPAHHRHRAPDTHSSLGSVTDPSTAATITRGIPREPNAAGERLRTQHGFSEISDEVNNDVRQRLDQPDLCCGSRVPFDPRAARVTGAFERVASAGSIKVVDVPAHNSFPPSEVRDLQAAPLDLHTLSLTWTAPGEDLDSGTASGYIIRLSEARHDLQESQFDVAPEETLLETSEALITAGVYQTAGTRVGVEVPLVRQFQKGHVYYVALKALDSDGYSSGVSNVARFSIPESSSNNNTAVSHGTTNHVGADPRTEEAPDSSSSRGLVHRNGEMTVFSERNFKPQVPRGSYTASEPEAEPSSSGNNEEQSLLSTTPASISDPREPEGSDNQRKRGGRKGRRRKKNKKSKRRKGRRRNDRRNNRQRGENSDTFAQDTQECDPTLLAEQEERDPVSLCDAQYSLALAITYFVQNNEHQYLDYLSAALHTLEQKMQPPWRAEPRVRRSGGRRRMPSNITERHS